LTRGRIIYKIITGNASYFLGWSYDPGPPKAGNVSAIFYAKETMNCVSIFIDESGTFSPYDHWDAYYLVSLVIHNQSKDISENVKRLDKSIGMLGMPPRAIHTAPLIRRELDYVNYPLELRRKILNSLFTFFRHVDIKYKTIVVEKKEASDEIELVARISKLLSRFLNEYFELLSAFDEVKIYYDNGQTQLTRLLVSVFNSVLDNVTFEKIVPVDYKLAQVADLCCTLELLSLKADSKSFSKSEKYFFPSIKQMRKSYLLPLRAKAFKGII
jgi:hypothetical protein